MALPTHIFFSYGCTRLEIGVQSVYEDVARDTNRGHTVRAVSESFHMSKDAGFKVVAHMMPDLPNVPLERDLEQFVEFFENPAFRPDGLKIYPTLVIRGTGLYELWRTERYKSYPPSGMCIFQFFHSSFLHSSFTRFLLLLLISSDRFGCADFGPYSAMDPCLPSPARYPNAARYVWSRKR